MPTATFTVKSIEELLSLQALSPRRNIQNGDIAIILGDTTRDTIASFEAELTSSPVEDPSSSYASYDLKIQWNLLSTSCFDSPIPRSLVVTSSALAVPPDSGWTPNPENPIFSYIAYPLAEDLGYRGFSIDYYNGKVWLTNKNITEIDLPTNTITTYPIGTLPDGATYLYLHGRCLTKADGKIHILGVESGSGTHHIFDTSTKVLSLSASTATTFQVYENIMIDASEASGKMYYIAKDYSYPKSIYVFDISLETWSYLGLCPGQVVSWSVDPDDSSKFYIVFASLGVYLLDSSDDSLTLKHSITSSNTISSPYSWPACLIWDKYKGFFISPSYSDIVYYDPITGDSGTLYNPDFFPPGEGGFYTTCAAYIGENAYIFFDSNEDDGYRIWSVTPWINWEKS